MAREHLPEFRDREVRIHLLYVTLDSSLRQVLGKHARVAKVALLQNAAVQLGLAGTVAAVQAAARSASDYLEGRR